MLPIYIISVIKGTKSAKGATRAQRSECTIVIVVSVPGFRILGSVRRTDPRVNFPSF